uniref:Uncharacterized protein n=1 Tax=Moniliophthora roreri TaxID=221103 RepID=A0A0W0G3B4_MONRR
MEGEPPKDAFHALTTLYKTALNTLVDEHEDDDIQKDLQTALGFIMASCRVFSLSRDLPSSASLLHALIQHTSFATKIDIPQAVAKLQSLLIEDEAGLGLMHKSFDDFLTKDPEDYWYIDQRRYQEILLDATTSCVIIHLKRHNLESEELSSKSTEYRYASLIWPVHWLLIGNNNQMPAESYQKLQVIMFRYLLQWLYTLDYQLQDIGLLEFSLNSLSKHPNDEFMQRACWHSSLLLPKYTRNWSVSHSFQNMLYNTARNGKMQKTEKDGQSVYVYKVDNMYILGFVQMAGGSQIYEEIMAALEKNSYPPIMDLSPEVESQLPVTITSREEVQDSV